VLNGKTEAFRKARLSTLESVALLTGIALLVIGAGTSARAVTITVDPLAGDIGIGELVEVQVAISGLGHLEAPSIGAIDLDLFFDSAILSPVDGSLGDPDLGDQLDVLGLGSLAIATIDVGSINFFELSFDLPADLESLQVGSFVIGSVIFEGLSAGVSALSLSVNSIADAHGDPLLVDTVVGSSVTVIPEPSTILLLAGGVVGIGVHRRRRSRR